MKKCSKCSLGIKKRARKEREIFFLNHETLYKYIYVICCLTDRPTDRVSQIVDVIGEENFH